MEMCKILNFAYFVTKNEYLKKNRCALTSTICFLHATLEIKAFVDPENSCVKFFFHILLEKYQKLILKNYMDIDLPPRHIHKQHLTSNFT